MEESKARWERFWESIESCNHDKISKSFPQYELDITFYITYNSQRSKVEFVNEETNQKGELSRDDFKRVLHNYIDITWNYLRSSNKQVENLPKDWYAAQIISNYYVEIG